MYLIDTVVLSELRKPQRNAELSSWIARQRNADLFLSVITIGEVERGIERQRTTNADFAAELAAWLDSVLALYSDRILPFDLQSARRWGLLSATLGNDSADLMISATALEHGLIVVTRNVGQSSDGPPRRSQRKLPSASRPSNEWKRSMTCHQAAP